MSASNVQAAVVGANGFLGSALVKGLHASGVTAVEYTRRSPCLSSDGTPDSRLLESSTIYWVASSINPWIAENHPERIPADRDQLSRLLDALPTATSATVVLLSSGGSVYDPAASVPYREDSECRPVGAYGRAKLELEQLLLSRRPESVIVRVANAYGPGQPLAPGQGVIGHWLRAVRDARPVELFGSRATARDYVFIDDIIAALLAVMGTEDTSAILNIGSGRATSLGELLDLVGDLTGAFEVVEYERRGFDVSRTWLDITRAQKELNWQPRIELCDGLRRTWDWLRSDPSR